MQIRLRRINGDDIILDYDSLEPVTVASMRQRVGSMLSIANLDAIRLIHAGRVMLDDNDRLVSYYSVRNDSVIHLVTQSPNASSTASETSATSSTSLPQPTAINTSTSRSAPQMRYQQIGNGIIMGSMEISGDEAMSLFGSLGSGNVPSILSSSLLNAGSAAPRNPEQQAQALPTAAAASGSSSIHPNRASSDRRIRIGTTGRRLAHRAQFPVHIEASVAALNILSRQIGNSQVEASLQPIGEGYTPVNGLIAVLANLGACLNGVQLPVNSTAIRLANGSFLEATQTVNDRVTRGQELNQLCLMMRSLSQAARSVAEALDSVTIGAEMPESGQVTRVTLVNTGLGSPPVQDTPTMTSQESDLMIVPISETPTPSADATPTYNSSNTGFYADRATPTSTSGSSADDPAMMVDREPSGNEEAIPNTDQDDSTAAVDHFMETLQQQLSSQFGDSITISSSGPNIGMMSGTIPLNFPAGLTSTLNSFAQSLRQPLLRPRPPASNAQSSTTTPPPSTTSAGSDNYDDDDESPSSSNNPPLD